MTKVHSFHIPVMGLGYTIDSPARVAHLGIDSVISLVDDILMEKVRKVYCGKHKLPYKEITEKTKDFRAKRITSYLNLINSLAEKKFEALRTAAVEKSHEIKEYFDLMPDGSALKQEFKRRTAEVFNLSELRGWLKDNLSMGSVDVNIMTKLDKENYQGGQLLSGEYNDAHAALRGFAESDLRSSLVLSAGMNPRLYGYMENFEDFYPDDKGDIKKKIILKVSDYKSAIIQGKFLAKKGLWVSEYRVESGLNCGGHAFATDGFLMGPILEEFKNQRSELRQTVHEVLVSALTAKERSVPSEALEIKVTAQGGVGTAEEHQFLMDHYNLDAIGWGTPFMLVPEATIVDEGTLQLLCDAAEDDLELSDISPLGVKFNNLKTSTKGVEKYAVAKAGNPGSNCTKRYLVSTKAYSEKAMCTASKQYIKIKMDEMRQEGVSPEDFEKRYNKLIEKECLCKGLTTSAYLATGIDPKSDGNGVSVCPGPNLAYFSKRMTLKEMVDHIYGRTNVISRTDRPHVFLNELKIYIDYLKDKMEETKVDINRKQLKYLTTFVNNLKEGVGYYNQLFNNLKGVFSNAKVNILNELKASEKIIQQLNSEIENY